MEVNEPLVEEEGVTVEETEPAKVSEATETVEIEKPEEEAKEMFDLPDGKKVDAEGLAKAWRDNFMPEFTRRSQELAALKSKTQIESPIPKKDDAEIPWKNPDWEPKTYQELADTIMAQSERKVWQQILDESTKAERETKEREAFISQEIEQIKTLDPKVNINAVMAHASKYAFSSLIPAFQNLKALEDAEKRVEERVLKNLKIRAGEPVGTSGSEADQNTAFPAGVQTGYEKAKWILRNQK